MGLRAVQHGSSTLWTLTINAHALLQIHVLQPALLSGQQQSIGTGSLSDSTKWSDVDKKFLVLPQGRSPARRLLALHAASAINHAVRHGWKQPGELTVPDEGFASPGGDLVLLKRFLQDARRSVVPQGMVLAGGGRAGGKLTGEDLASGEQVDEELAGGELAGGVRASTVTASEM